MKRSLSAADSGSVNESLESGVCCMRINGAGRPEQQALAGGDQGFFEPQVGNGTCGHDGGAGREKYDRRVDEAELLERDDARGHDEGVREIDRIRSVAEERKRFRPSLALDHALQ